MTDQTPKPEKNRPDKRMLREDVVWSNVDVDEGDDVSLEPIDPSTTAARQRMRESEKPALVLEVVEDPPPFQFTIKQMLIANAVLAVTFVLMRMFAPSGIAGFLGVSAFFAAIFVAVYQPEQRAIQIAWWCLLGLYVVACVFAVAGALVLP